MSQWDDDLRNLAIWISGQLDDYPSQQIKQIIKEKLKKVEQVKVKWLEHKLSHTLIQIIEEKGTNFTQALYIVEVS